MLSKKLKPLGFTPMHLKSIADTLDWIEASATCAMLRQPKLTADSSLLRTMQARNAGEDEDYVPDDGGVDDDDYVPDDGVGATAVDDDVEPQPTDEEGNDLLCNAVLANDLDGASSLVESGHEINVMGTAEGDAEQRHVTPLMHAVTNYKSEMATYLIEAGANLNKVEHEWGFSAMHWAVAADPRREDSTSHREILNKLLEAKADLERVANDGSRAIHLACTERLADRVALLLHESASVTAQNAEGDTALHISVRLFDAASIPLLLEAVGAARFN
jgi:ankyrin repeat protein